MPLKKLHPKHCSDDLKERLLIWRCGRDNTAFEQCSKWIRWNYSTIKIFWGNDLFINRITGCQITLYSTGILLEDVHEIKDEQNTTLINNLLLAVHIVAAAKWKVPELHNGDIQCCSKPE